MREVFARTLIKFVLTKINGLHLTHRQRKEVEKNCFELDQVAMHVIKEDDWQCNKTSWNKGA